MTTSIELFKFTNPHPTTKAVQWMNNEQVMRKLIEEIIDNMQSPDDVTNGAYFWLEAEGYTIEAEIEFSAYWVASWERFDWGYEDFGSWETCELTEINILKCYKGDDDSNFLELDLNRIYKEVNNYFKN